MIGMFELGNAHFLTKVPKILHHQLPVFLRIMSRNNNLSFE